MCNCGCPDNIITTTQGEKGDDGTTTIITYNTTEIINTTSNRDYTVQRLNNSSDSIAPAASGYNWAVLTVPTVAAANLVTFQANMQINASDSHVVTLQVKIGASNVSNMTRQVNCITNGSSSKWVIDFGFELASLTTGDIIYINILSDSGAVSAVFKGGYCKASVYQ